MCSLILSRALCVFEIVVQLRKLSATFIVITTELFSFAHSFFFHSMAFNYNGFVCVKQDREKNANKKSFN
jgi:hypothetical protein